MTNFKINPEFVKKMDRNDPLKKFRKQFLIPEHNNKKTVYLCGNSLGLQPVNTKKYINQALNDWKKFGVEGHFRAQRPWFSYHTLLAKKLAEIVGALPNEVVVMNSLSVNLHILLTTFYLPDKKKYKILIEENAFPSDRYIVQTQAQINGYDPEKAIIVLKTKTGEHNHRTEDIIHVINENKNSLALVLLGGVNYYSGQAFELEKITKAAHSAGIVVGFDLAHAAGNIHLQLHKWQVDFAAWCSYKYLNSSPGGVSGIYIHDSHASNIDLPRLGGWWGNDPDTRFSMPDKFIPRATAEGWQLSNAPILPMAAHLSSLEIFSHAGMKNLIKKSQLLTAYLEYVLNAILTEFGNNRFTIITPIEPAQRGCQLSLQFSKDGKRLFKFLGEKGIIADWRDPDVIRMAPVPLYNSFSDVYKVYKAIRQFYKSNQ